MDGISEPLNQPAFIAILKEFPSQLVHAVAQTDGWRISIRKEQRELWLVDARGEPCQFRTFDALAFYLTRTGVTNYRLDTSALDPADAATVQRIEHAAHAANYHEWLRGQIQEALDDAAPPVPDSIVRENFAARRDALMKKVATDES